METIDLAVHAKYRDEIRELKKEIDLLKKKNEELSQKVLDVYGAYETLQYSSRGRLVSCSQEVSRLRREVEMLKKEMCVRGWEEQLP